MPKILIVDDDFTTRLALHEVLEDLGYEVAGESEAGRQAVDMALDLKPDLILMDIVLPGDMDGISAAERIKQEWDAAIIFISGYSDAIYIERAKQVEPFGYIIKPFDEKEIKALVEISLYKRDLEWRLKKEVEERKRKEQELGKARKEWQDIFDGFGHPAMLLDDHHFILHANVATEKATGKSQSALIGQKCYEVFHTKGKPPRNCPYERMLSSGRLETVEMEIEAFGGVFLVSCTPMMHDQGQLQKVIHIATDVTGQKEAEMALRRSEKKYQAQLLQSQKMEALANLTGGIAHDYNNLLSVVMVNLGLALQETPAPSEQAEFLEAADAATRKMKDLTYSLLSLSRGGAPVRQMGALSPLLERIVEEIPTNDEISLEKSIPPDLWPIPHDPQQLVSVFRNVVTNAVEAMPDGGTLCICTENMRIDQAHQEKGFHLKPGRYVKVTISDQGKGIPDAHLEKLFDPYFSTKPMGAQKGMGLGLATAYAIINGHDGHITVDSRPGKGTVVSIYLPAPETSLPKESTKKLEVKKVYKARILVMDDEEMIRHMAHQALKRLGYEVETAKDGLEALAAYKKGLESSQPFDAVILDLTVKGGMGGKQTLPQLQKMDPHVKAIVSSGYFNDPVMAQFKAYGFKAALAKPYEIGKLKKSVENLLSE